MLVIYLKDLLIEAKHGVHQKEKETAQPFNFNVALTLSSDQSSVSDDLEETFNYSELKAIVRDIAENNSFNLLERLAGEIARRLLSDDRVQKVVISIDKTAVFKDSVPGVRLEMSRGVTG